MFEYVFEIYDTNYHVWYEDYKTYDIKSAETYFNVLAKENNINCIRVITRFKVGE